MFRNAKSATGTTARPERHPVLRHADGSIDFDSYRQIACAARRATIAYSVQRVFSFAGGFAGRLVSRIARGVSASASASRLFKPASPGKPRQSPVSAVF